MVPLKSGSRPPWVGLGASVWLQIASGNAYTFPLYSHSLKSVLGFNQRQVTMLGVANDIGENVGIVPGIACNKFPPWVVLLVGAFASFFGYGVLWLAVSRTVESLPYWLLWLALCVATNSSAWLGTAVLVTNMRNFPISRGTVAGILKGYGGLSAAVYTEIFSMLLHNSSSKLLLFLSLGIPILCIVMMYAVRPCTPASGEDSAEHSHFVFIQAASVCPWVVPSHDNSVGVSEVDMLLAEGEGAIGIAQGAHDTTILLSLFSFCNFVGRLSGGAVSEHFVRTKTIPRTIWMTFTQIIMIITYLLFASALDGTLYIATAVLGICYGVQFSIMVPTASELFGLKNFGIFFNFMSLGNPLGALLFSSLLTGYLYDNEAAKQHGISCLGPNCFRLTFLALAGVCAVGTVLSLVLTRRIKPVYQMLYAGGSFRLPQCSNH
ncbi:major facilitator superfamily protein [Actinidia rufa]|uniref:Major facilitator superfamily protein n=1 Tax=Actinidia rufa TaxID=165716 RepID=A0A7J0E4A0_9ERIC|nr:major facilitator superfamily protein [Actinidia rufa]